MIRLIGMSPRVDEATLQRFNALFDGRVPPAMLAFYRSANGGYLREEGEDADPTGVAFLIPLGDDPMCIEGLYQGYIQGFPHLARYIPFADDSFGNCYLLSLRDEDYGSIYLHLLDEEELMLIEDSFEELMRGLEMRQDAAGRQAPAAAT